MNDAKIKALPPYRTRLLAERQDLADKVGRLGVFLESDRFEDVLEAEKPLLREQFAIMGRYLSILDERLEPKRPMQAVHHLQSRHQRRAW